MKKKKNIESLSKALKENLLRRKSGKKNEVTKPSTNNNIKNSNENNITKQ